MSANHPSRTETELPSHISDAEVHAEDRGYHKGLKARQIQMIAIGGAIGTGLFMGAGGRLASAGPSLAIIYAVCGFFAFLILRALGELIMHRPSCGSFVSYSREFFGEKAAFATGWLYWLNWAMTAIVDATAIALYMHYFSTYWPVIDMIPQWGYALGALALVLSLNLISVKVFGELEFWFALIKVVALVAFLITGLWCLIFQSPIPGHARGFALIAEHGGFFPHGLLPAILVIQGVVFAYASIELIGTAAGETQDPRKVIPRAINTVIVRIGIFYVGSVLLLAMLLPYTAYQAGVSPFVTFFSTIGFHGSIGTHGAGIAMNLIVLTAALSSLNAGLYSTGRIMRSMAIAGSAPQFAAKMSKSGVPFGGIAFTTAVALLGVVLNAFVPAEAFEIVLNVAAIGIISAWGMIILCQMRLLSWANKGLVKRPAFRLPCAPWSGWLTLLFLLAVLVLMAFDWPVGTCTISSLALIIPALIGGWYLCRDRIQDIAAKREHASEAHRK